MTEWSYTVKFWTIRKRDYRKPYQLRWFVGTSSHSESFLTSGLAKSFEAQLITAANAGEPFDMESGLPKSLVVKERDITWYEHARNYIEMKWDDAPGSTRRTLAEAMATVTPALVKDTKGMPDTRAVRTALYSWAFNKNRWTEEIPADVAKVLDWFERKSLPTSSLAERLLVRAALKALSKKLDGKTAAAATIQRKRAIFHNSLEYAVDAELLTENPLTRIKWKAPEQVGEEVDPACVPNPGQAAKLLSAVRDQSPRGRRLVAFFGCMYYAAARPHGGHRVAPLRLRPAAPGVGHAPHSGNAPSFGLSMDRQRQAAREAGAETPAAKGGATGPDPTRTGGPAAMARHRVRHCSRWSALPDAARWTDPGHRLRRSLG